MGYCLNAFPENGIIEPLCLEFIETGDRLMSRRTKARKKAWEKELSSRQIMAEFMNSRRAGLLALINDSDATDEQRAQMICNLGDPVRVDHLGNFVRNEQQNNNH